MCIYLKALRPKINPTCVCGYRVAVVLNMSAANKKILELKVWLVATSD